MGVYAVINHNITPEQHSKLQALGYVFDNTNGSPELSGGTHFMLGTHIKEYSTDCTLLCLNTAPHTLCESVADVINLLSA